MKNKVKINNIKIKLYSKTKSVSQEVVIADTSDKRKA
jgi:hypothetical protein